MATGLTKEQQEALQKTVDDFGRQVITVVNEFVTALNKVSEWCKEHEDEIKEFNAKMKEKRENASSD